MTQNRARNKKLPRDDDNGQLSAYAWPGGYPIIYLDGDNSILCPTCADESDAEPEQIDKFRPVAADIHWEGAAISCDNCSVEIESAYGEIEG